MNVLLIDAHPDEGRYCSHLLGVYGEALPPGAEVTLVALRDLAAGEMLELGGERIQLAQPVARGHKFALGPIAEHVTLMR